MILFGTSAWSYLYIAYPLMNGSEPSSALDAVNTMSNVPEQGPAAAVASPNDTIAVLANHDPNAQSLSIEEEMALLQMFNTWDTKKDGKLDLDEFKTFIDLTVEPVLRFGTLDLDKDGVISMKEIYLVLSAFDSTDIYACDDTDQLLLDVFGYDADPRDNMYYEYLAQLWLYELDVEKIGSISLENYVSYIETEEWIYHNHDENDFVSFDEFKNGAFGSLCFQTWQKLINLAATNNDVFDAAYAQLAMTDIATIAQLQLTTTPQQFDDVIQNYMDGKTYTVSTGHSPTKSLLYALPLPYELRRRLGKNEGSRGVGIDFEFRCCCFSGDEMVKIMQQGIVKEVRVSELAVGNYVFDGDEYSKIVAIETGYSAIKMMKLSLNDSMTLTLTSEHLLFDANHNSIHTKNIQIGDVLLNDLVVSNIEYNQFGIPFTPFTMSGKIEVNGVTASVYSVASSHDTAHECFKLIRFLSQHVSEYYTATFVEYILTDIRIIYEYAPNFWTYACNIYPVIYMIGWIVLGTISLMRQFLFYLFASYYPLE